MTQTHIVEDAKGAYTTSTGTETSLAPNKAVTQEFSEYIHKASPKFVDIYNEACTAETHELSEIAGIGYRKALEFLIKDYLCDEKPEDEKDRIVKKFLGNVIKEDVANLNLRAVAERAVWLGNDEAHYYRKWKDKDIVDLKNLVRLAVGWIEQELITRQYVQDMPDDKK